METIIKKTVSIEFQGKRCTLSDDITIGMILVHLGLPEDTPVRMTTTKEGFLIIPQTEKN